MPFDKIVTALTDGGNNDTQPVLRALRLIRIMKIIRAVRFLQKLNQIEEKDTTGTLKTCVSVFRATFMMVFVAHVLACIFYLMIDKTSEDNWMAAFSPEVLDFEQKNNDERYILGLYWAVITICTVGYGDILPVNHNGVFCSVLLIVRLKGTSRCIPTAHTELNTQSAFSP